MSSEERGKIKTLVVEDEPKIAEGICGKITSLDDDFAVVGKAYNGKEALAKIEELNPHVVFTDIAMPEMDGMELVREIRKRNPNMIIVIVSGYSDFSYAQKAIRYGVFNYLLKPLQEDSLLETMFDIKKRLSIFNVREQRHILYSKRFHMAAEGEGEFLLSNICMGNVIYNTQDEEVQKFYREQTELIPWNKIMEELFEEETEWFLADEHALNQKMAAVKVKEGEKEEILNMLCKMPELIQEYTILPVSICMTEEKVGQDEIWDYTKRLRNIMKQRLIPGHNCRFFLEKDEKFSNDMLEIVKMKLNTYIKNYFISTDLENFLNEMQTIFKYMESNHAPQESIEKVCLYLIKLLELSKADKGEGNLEGIQEKMIRSISMSVSEKQLFENLMREFLAINRYMETIYEGNVEVRLLEYVDENYLTIESVESVAEEFGYNYAYLSRLFKKKVGESMNRYITEKKMKFARELLAKNSDMTLLEISEMCGYHDYRYFSRVFKAETGETPGEYRSRICG